MRRSSAASRRESAVAPGFSGAQNTPATASPRSRNASSTALPKSLCPMMAIRIAILPFDSFVILRSSSAVLRLSLCYDISYIIRPNLGVQCAKMVGTFVSGGTPAPERIALGWQRTTEILSFAQSEQRRSYGRSQLSVRSRAHQRARPRAARHGGSDGRPPLADLPRTDSGLLERLEADIQDHLRHPHSLSVVRHRLLGSG